MSDEDPPAAVLGWNAVDTIDGVTVHAYFFMPHSLGQLDAVRKELPVFGNPLPEPVQVQGTEFKLSRLQAQPDAVYHHGTGYLSLTQAQPSSAHDGSNWRGMLQPLDIWTALANAMATSATLRQPAAALLRAQGALYFLAPSPPALRKLLQALTATEVGAPPLSATEVAERCMQEAAAP